ncbi:MAG: hypothetical protein GY870_21490 [archaeon]|nr:hypothetical protein [archaeon]
MTEETMTSKERLWTAIGLEKPDRPPIAILGTAAPIAHLNGKNLPDFFTKGQGHGMLMNVFKKSGGWDLDLGSAVSNDILFMKMASTVAMGTKFLYPGLDLPDDYQLQVDEQEYIKYEDYDTIIEKGWKKFMYQDYINRLLEPSQAKLFKRKMVKMVPQSLKSRRMFGKLGVQTMYPSNIFVLHPFFRLSVGRSMTEFVKDLYYKPEKPMEAMQRMTDDYIKRTIRLSKMQRAKLAFMAEERSSTTFFPPRIFEKYWMPYTLQIVNALWDEGIVTWMHLDTSFDGNFKYFKQVPRGSMVLALDGTSDIFLAKKILNDHLCLSGDVPAALLSVGTPAQVEAYVKKLIDKIGGNGGYILSSGCELPEAIKMENLQAMIRTGKTYGLTH